VLYPFNETIVTAEMGPVVQGEGERSKWNKRREMERKIDWTSS